MKMLPNCEFKNARAALTAVGESGLFEGYASVFGIEDQGQDVVAPGAFTRSLSRRGARGVKLLYQHDPREPIGVWDEIQEDAHGLKVKGRLLMELTRGREVHALMRERVLDGLSIGFEAVKARTDPRSGVRTLQEVDLWEISVVTFPMLPQARVSAVKHKLETGNLPTERDFERLLTRDAGFSRTQAQRIIRDGYRSLSAVRDAGDSDLAAAIRRAARVMAP